MARQLNRLTDSALKKAFYETHGNTKLFDGGGLYLHIQQSGRYWRMKYRIGGRERLLSIGVYPQVSLKQARDERDHARQQVSQGVDPVQARRERQQSQREKLDNSFQALADEWLVKVHAETVGATTYEKNKRRLERLAYPRLGVRPISEIQAPEVLDVLRRIERQGHVDSAHRVKTLVGQVLRYGIARGVAARDVTADLKGALAPIRQKHFAAQTTPDELAPVLNAIDGYRGAPETVIALELLPILLLRPGNIRALEWDQVDIKARRIELAITKNGDPLVVPLSDQALAALQRIESLSRHRSRFVFPGARSTARPMSDNAMGAALRNLGMKDQQTAHGFRAVARTMLVERLGFAVELVEMQLGHRVADTHGRAYNRTQWLNERAHMMQAWADYLDTLRDRSTT
ncbi:integrase arm-type DNA-binding domain-containing protein [uncultured Halovibrio sp.]|uniref:tyrosine-type recombinase/integrase n=1 Tax=uncultured Halovibrio sp. TaxID=985049 RepID=UPI0025F8E781|nr:integrase arm-type DNA-binding domain-containing protein [uncultured Halovibrio sp.]